MKDNDKLQIRNSTAEFLTFTSQANENTIDVLVADNTVWLTQKMMQELYQSSKSNISEHLSHIFKDSELDENAVVRVFRTTAADDKQYNTKFYSLDAIIAVGFKINSERAVQFRQWAIHVLHDFSIRGYVLDKERLKNGAFLNEDYFDELLEEIREIRASERRFYQKITDIYSTAMDYNKDSSTTKAFFVYCRIQAKLLPKLQKPLQKASSKNIASFRIDCMRAISIRWSSKLKKTMNSFLQRSI